MYLNSKKTFTLLAGLMLALVFVGTSCKDDDEVKTSKDYLTAHDWKLTDYTIAGSSLIEACDKDDIFTFHEDGEFHYDAGGNKCDESDLQQETGNWSISSSTTPETLTITYDGGTSPIYEAKITDLDSDKMVLTVEFSIGGVASTEVKTFEKI